MADPLIEARKRRFAGPGGAKPPAPRAAMALTKSQAYQDAADAPATLRAYATDLATLPYAIAQHHYELRVVEDADPTGRDRVMPSA